MATARTRAAVFHPAPLARVTREMCCKAATALCRSAGDTEPGPLADSAARVDPLSAISASFSHLSMHLFTSNRHETSGFWDYDGNSPVVMYATVIIFCIELLCFQQLSNVSGCYTIAATEQGLGFGQATAIGAWDV